jgi:F-type H+-transporting ATPase subunit gamma
MAKARAIAKRRKAVQNIRKITRTMQLIATARFQSAFNKATATRPYVENITRLAGELSQGQGPVEHPLLKSHDTSGRVRLLVLTSNRGLCGGYNSAILRKATETLAAQEQAGRQVDLYMVGKKGIAYCKFLGRSTAWSESRYEGAPPFAEVERIATEMMDDYTAGRTDAVYVAYTRFVSTSSQFPELLQLLPIPRIETPAAATGAEVQYEFSPPAAQLLGELLPEVVKVRLFQCFNDAAVSEQTARMVAMKAATDAAGDMIRTLGQKLNRARQSQITLELLDIVAGAEALA